MTATVFEQLTTLFVLGFIGVAAATSWVIAHIVPGKGKSKDESH